MNEEMMTTGTGGFSGSANAKGPVAGFDPVMKFRKKMAKRKKIMLRRTNEILSNVPRHPPIGARRFRCLRSLLSSAPRDLWLVRC